MTIPEIRLYVNKVAVCAVMLALLMMPSRLWAQSQPTVEDLQKQIDALRAEVAAMKAANGSAMAASQTAPGAALMPTANAPGSAPAAPGPLAGITKVLGDATLTGFADLYYGVNFNHPAAALTGGQAIAQNRFFDDRQSQFALNMLELVLDKAPSAESRAGYHVAFGFGRAMDVVNASDTAAEPHFAEYLKEAYVSYLAPAGKGLQVDFGKFVTPHGAEVIETKDNWNYSRGLLFYYAIPYYHFGARAKYAFSDKVALSGYLVNGWNNIIDNNTGKTGGLTLALTPTKKLTITQNYMAGPEQASGQVNSDAIRQLSDTVVSYAITPKLTVQANYDYGVDHDAANHPVHWAGVAGYAKYTFNPRYAVATRYEFFNDHDGFTTGTARNQLQEITATLERRMAGHFITRMEYRHDWSDQPFFTRGFTPSKLQNTFTAGLVYTLEKAE